MSLEAPLTVVGATLPPELREAIDRRYLESGAERYGIATERFRHYVVAVVARYGPDFNVAENTAIVRSLHIEELVLARACSAGYAAAWDEFIMRYREGLYRAALRITRDEGTGRELADELYAELYGLPNREQCRVSKLDYYMGRGSLEGWLRTVLAQRHVDRCRAHSKNVSLDERLEAGAAFPAAVEAGASIHDETLASSVGQTLAELAAEERFLLASYYLDQRTLAVIGRQLGVHESTVSRKLEKLIARVRKRLRKRLLSNGMDARRCEDILADLDVRDLNVDVAASLRQEERSETF